MKQLELTIIENLNQLMKQFDMQIFVFSSHAELRFQNVKVFTWCSFRKAVDPQYPFSVLNIFNDMMHMQSNIMYTEVKEIFSANTYPMIEQFFAANSWLKDCKSKSELALKLEIASASKS